MGGSPVIHLIARLYVGLINIYTLKHFVCNFQLQFFNSRSKHSIRIQFIHQHLIDFVTCYILLRTRACFQAFLYVFIILEYSFVIFKGNIEDTSKSVGDRQTVSQQGILHGRVIICDINLKGIN